MTTQTGAPVSLFTLPSSLMRAACRALPPMVLGFGLLLLALAPASPARAEAVDDMMEALQIDEILEIMHQEGLSYGADLANDMFPGGHNDRWGAILKEIYDPEKMRIVMRRHFADVLGQTDMHRLTAFFGSDLGTRIVQLELSARRALIHDDMEAAAREAFRVADPEAPRMRQLTRFVEVGDLLEANVTGALNASFKFYSGLVDGGALQMSESDILSDVWGQEEETRVDTEEWLHAFLMLAYEPLSDEELEQYIDVSATPEGRVLNRALFAGFNAMYDEISYALGLAAAEQMGTQDL